MRWRAERSACPHACPLHSGPPSPMPSSWPATCELIHRRMAASCAATHAPSCPAPHPAGWWAPARLPLPPARPAIRLPRLLPSLQCSHRPLSPAVFSAGAGLLPRLWLLRPGGPGLRHRRHLRGGAVGGHGAGGDRRWAGGRLRPGRRCLVAAGSAAGQATGSHPPCQPASPAPPPPSPPVTCRCRVQAWCWRA